MKLWKQQKKLVSDQDIKNGYIRPFVWRGSEMMGVSAQNTKNQCSNSDMGLANIF